jgi:hypothetical protein
MTRRRILVTLLTLLSVFRFERAPFATAQGLIETTATYRFGESIRLTVQVSDMAPISRAAVFLRPESSDSARVILADSFDPGKSQAEIEIDPDQLSLSAFERLFYWWQIDLETGEVLSTQILDLEYQDDRYDWHTRSENQISLHWHDRSLSEGQVIFEAAQRALSQIEQSFTLLPSSSIKVILYNSPQELQTALALIGLAHTAGHAEPALGIVYLSAPVGAEGMVQLERLLPHELVHLLLDQGSNTTFEYPPWLAEGMATLVEGAPTTAGHSMLEQALLSDNLLRLTDLCSAFPVSPEHSQLAYAQSGSFLRYLIDVYGVGGINKLLDAYQEGASCTGAVQRVYQRTLDQLQAEWEDTLQVSARQGSLSLFTMASVVLGLLTVAYIFFRRRSKYSRSAAARMDEHDRANHI